MWDDERDACALELQADGYSMSQIAEIMFGDPGKRNAVVGRLYRLARGAKPRPAKLHTEPVARPEKMPRPKHMGKRKKCAWSNDDIRELCDAIKAGEARAQIAARFGVSTKTIQLRLKIERARGNPLIPPAKTVLAGSAARSKQTTDERKARASVERKAMLESMFVPGTGVPLVELGHRQCKFSTGWDAENGRHLFCGDPTDLGKSYCAHHHAICWQPQKTAGGRIKAKDGKLTEFARIVESAR